jgi:N-methylhydantoinase B
MELFEVRSPYKVLTYECLTDWEGAGEFRGGPGVHVDMVAEMKEGDPAYIQTGNSDGMTIAPWGWNGGEEPPFVDMYILRGGDPEKKEVLRTISQDVIFPGDRVVTKASGGGGWGDPLERDVNRVLQDYLDRLVSLERSQDTYGVIIDPETKTVDIQGTEELRKKKKDAKKTADAG